MAKSINYQGSGDLRHLAAIAKEQAELSPTADLVSGLYDQVKQQEKESVELQNTQRDKAFRLHSQQLDRNVDLTDQDRARQRLNYLDEYSGVSEDARTAAEAYSSKIGDFSKTLSAAQQAALDSNTSLTERANTKLASDFEAGKLAAAKTAKYNVNQAALYNPNLTIEEQAQEQKDIIAMKREGGIFEEHPNDLAELQKRFRARVGRAPQAAEIRNIISQSEESFLARTWVNAGVDEESVNDILDVYAAQDKDNAANKEIYESEVERLEDIRDAGSAQIAKDLASFGARQVAANRASLTTNARPGEVGFGRTYAGDDNDFLAIRNNLRKGTNLDGKQFSNLQEQRRALIAAKQKEKLRIAAEKQAIKESGGTPIVTKQEDGTFAVTAVPTKEDKPKVTPETESAAGEDTKVEQPTTIRSTSDDPIGIIPESQYGEQLFNQVEQLQTELQKIDEELKTAGPVDSIGLNARRLYAQAKLSSAKPRLLKLQQDEQTRYRGRALVRDTLQQQTDKLSQLADESVGEQVENLSDRTAQRSVLGSKVELPANALAIQQSSERVPSAAEGGGQTQSADRANIIMDQIERIQQLPDGPRKQALLLQAQAELRALSAPNLRSTVGTFPVNLDLPTIR